MARLNAALASSRGSFFRRGIAGRVSEERVVLRKRLPPLTMNSYAPVFSGRFRVTDGCTELYGAFGPSRFVRISTYLWFALVVLIFPTAMAALASREDLVIAGAHGGLYLSFISWVFFTGAGLVLAVIGYLIVRFSQWIARDDIAFVSDAITEGLRGAV